MSLIPIKVYGEPVLRKLSSPIENINGNLVKFLKDMNETMLAARGLGLAANQSIPLFGNIGRLVEQKGVDIMLDALAEMLGAGFQFVLLGKGAPAFERAYQDLARTLPSQVAALILAGR